MNRFKTILSVSILFCIISLSACGKDISIVGKWEYYTPMTLTNIETNETKEVESALCICFNRNGTGYYDSTNPFIPGRYPEEDDVTAEKFNYKLNGDQLMISFDSGKTYYYKYNVSDSTLKLTNDMKAVFVLNRKTK